MKIRAQIAMVLNLDKCIGCHTCSVTCKNVWTNREGMEYAWFNNVETKPGIGYPKDWENQNRWKGGWTRKKNGKIEPKITTNPSPSITSTCKRRPNSRLFPPLARAR
jgi:nitrate reductase / nitrite oxidoreductase, beta subunit